MNHDKKYLICDPEMGHDPYVEDSQFIINLISIQWEIGLL